MPLQGLAGKVVIVTGAGSGIGRASAERLVAEGARVALVDSEAERVEQALADLGGGEVAGAVADVSTEGGTESYFAVALERFGRIDGLHANAGIEGPAGPIVDVAMADYDRLMAVNLRGVFLSIRQMLRTLAQQGSGGAVVCTASALGLRGRPGLAPYAAAKAGVISLTKSAAMEGGPSGIRVNAVLPGPTDTSMIHRLVEESGDPAGAEAALHAGVPLGRYGRPSEIAALAAWLLSDESSFVNGGIFTVDGGESAG